MSPNSVALDLVLLDVHGDPHLVLTTGSATAGPPPPSGAPPEGPA